MEMSIIAMAINVMFKEECFTHPPKEGCVEEYIKPTPPLFSGPPPRPKPIRV